MISLVSVVAGGLMFSRSDSGKNRETLLALGVVVVLVLFLVAVNFTSIQLFLSDILVKRGLKDQYKYVENYASVLFLSNDGKPSGLIKAQATRKHFVLSPKMTAVESSENTAVANYGYLPAVVVLAANDKNVLSIMRVYDKEKLKECRLSWFDSNDTRILSSEGCTELLEDLNAVTITFDVNACKHVTNAFVVVRSQNIEIRACGGPALQTATMVVLRTMFNNADRVIAGSNLIVRQISR
jgi:hypothetical protein